MSGFMGFIQYMISSTKENCFNLSKDPKQSNHGFEQISK